MPDIAMCQGNECPLKETCYRYKAEPSKYRQSYLAESPFYNRHCNYYIQISAKYQKNDDCADLEED